MTLLHYVASVRDRVDIDPQFSSLLRHHRLEESQHAKLDTMIVEAIAQPLSEREAPGRHR
jgi:predicted metal-dependent hydrolase